MPGSAECEATINRLAMGPSPRAGRGNLARCINKTNHVVQIDFGAVHCDPGDGVIIRIHNHIQIKTIQIV